VVKKRLVGRQESSIILAILALLLTGGLFLVFASSAQEEIRFDGMYLEYEVTVGSDQGVQISHFIGVEDDPTKMNIHSEMWMDEELVAEYTDVITLEDRIIVESSRPKAVGLICWELWPVPLEVGRSFNVTDPETGEGIPYAEVTRGQTVSIMGKSCDCWVIEDTGWKSYVEKTTGVTVKEESWEALETTITELIDTNIPNFPPPTQPPFFFPELPESIIGILTQFHSVLFPFAGLLFVLGPICLAFRKAGVFIGLGIGVLIDLVVWLAWSSLSEAIPMLPSLAEYWYMFLIFSVSTIAVFAGIGFFAGVGLAVLFSGIGGALLSCYVLGFNPWAIIGGFVAGIVWLYATNRLIAKITEKKKEEMKLAPTLPSPLTYPSIAPSPPTMQQTCPSCGAEVKSEMAYCPNCGQKIMVQRTCSSCGFENPLYAKFCAKCGSQLGIEAKPLEKPVPTPAALLPLGEEIPAVEKVLGGIEVAKGTTYVGATYYGLYFTPKRVIVAKTAGVPWIWVLVSLFIGALIRGRRAKKRFKELSELSSESILTADKKNFGILYLDITRVEMKKGTFRSKIEIILTSREKHKFYILKEKEFEDYVNLIRSVLPNKTYVS